MFYIQYLTVKAFSAKEAIEAAKKFSEEENYGMVFGAEDDDYRVVLDTGVTTLDGKEVKETDENFRVWSDCVGSVIVTKKDDADSWQVEAFYHD